MAEGETVARRRTGRPGTQVAIVPAACGVLGVHLGVGTVRLWLVDVGGHDHGREGFDYDPHADAETVLRRAAANLSACVHAAPRASPTACSASASRSPVPSTTPVAGS